VIKKGGAWAGDMPDDIHAVLKSASTRSSAIGPPVDAASAIARCSYNSGGDDTPAVMRQMTPT